jgi:hypothetical protein
VDGVCEFALISSKAPVPLTEVNEVEGFKGEKGNTIKPSRRNAKFVEIKLEGKAYADGKSGWYPAMFGVLFKYRGTTKITPATALGIKFTNRKTGNKEEHWFNEPDVSFVMGCKTGESFAHYLIVEIPKEVTAFLLQGPAALQHLQLKK